MTLIRSFTPIPPKTGKKNQRFSIKPVSYRNWIVQVEIDSVTKQKAVRERTFKVRLSESEYQLLDANNPFGSIAKLLRQSALESNKDS